MSPDSAFHACWTKVWTSPASANGIDNVRQIRWTRPIKDRKTSHCTVSTERSGTMMTIATVADMEWPIHVSAQQRSSKLLSSEQIVVMQNLLEAEQKVLHCYHSCSVRTVRSYELYDWGKVPELYGTLQWTRNFMELLRILSFALLDNLSSLYRPIRLLRFLSTTQLLIFCLSKL